MSPAGRVGAVLRRLQDADTRRRAAHVFRHRLPSLGARADVFNLDLHVAVIADVQVQLARHDLSLVDWTLSGHSWVAGRERDPVAVVNERTWRDFDATTPGRFQQAYGAYLRRFRSFVAAYPPCFALLYEGLGRPALAVAATRYEWPFTHSADRWSWLDEGLRRGTDEGWLTLVANNRADADYVANYAGLRPAVLPGGCAYTAGEYTGGTAAAVICTPDDGFARMACGRLTAPAIPLRAGLGTRYERRALYDHRALVVIPYNVSLMSLFEHYSAGCPLYVPTAGFLKRLMKEHPAAVLSSLSFCQVTGQAAARRGEIDLNDIRDEAVVDWYLDRADFYDPEWMPSIRQFESWTHLDHLLATDDHRAISEQMQTENAGRFERIAAAYDATGWFDAIRGAAA